VGLPHIGNLLVSVRVSALERDGVGIYTPRRDCTKARAVALRLFGARESTKISDSKPCSNVWRSKVYSQTLNINGTGIRAYLEGRGWVVSFDLELTADVAGAVSRVCGASLRVHESRGQRSAGNSQEHARYEFLRDHCGLGTVWWRVLRVDGGLQKIPTLYSFQ
jgi:hypothetical protein